MLSTATAQIAGAQNNPAPNRAGNFYTFILLTGGFWPKMVAVSGVSTLGRQNL